MDAAFGKAGFDGLTEAACSPRRRLADFEVVASAGLVREPGMGKI